MDFTKRYRVKPGRGVRLTPALADDTAGLGRARSASLHAHSVARLADAQERLYAQDRWAVLVILQAMDAAGKDGTIKHVMSGVNPLGCQVFSFKAPSAEELDHDYLWRSVKALPERGRIGLHNRSYYEEVLVARVHPEILERQRLPPATTGRGLWARRFREINRFERYLTDNGTRVVKFFLHVSKAEQRRRFLERIDQRDKHWKFSPRDVAEREHWDAYMAAYADAIRHTSTRWAPWHVIPADHKWFTRAAVAEILADAMDDLGLVFPKATAAERASWRAIRRRLAADR
jgi:PPK2 family polyphosphate:nucleotide phosphotransferase